MSRLTRLSALGAVLSVAATLMTACGGIGLPGGDSGDKPDPTDPYVIISGWAGCDVLDDINPVREFLGVEAIKGDGLMDSDPGQRERPSCQAQVDLATFLVAEGTEYEKPWTGQATISVSISPFPTAGEASADYQEIIDQLNDMTLEDAQESEVDGDWDESYVLSGQNGGNYSVNAHARYDNWYIRVLLSVEDDPGRNAYEKRPDDYPGSTADDIAVYPFTMPELLDWVTAEYLPQTQSEILARIDEDACKADPAAC